MIKVSIIIPVYNVENYLEQCLESAINQTLKDIEIICINDGSTDKSPEILEKAAKKDQRIRIISKPNSGYGHSMNLGLDMAKGKYLIFLESDDFILPELCETLYGLCEKYNLDMIKSDYYEFKTRGGKIYSKYMRASGADTYHHVIDNQKNRVIYRSAMYTWSCMYNREFINTHHIRHHETPGASYQDNGFWFQTLMYCKRIYLIAQAFYMYRQDNPESSIHHKGKIYAFSDEYAFIRKKIYEFPGEKQIYLRICAYFNLNHNMTRLEKVDKNYTEELLALIDKDFRLYRDEQAWDLKELKELDGKFLKRLMLCLAQPKELKNRIWKYIDRDVHRKEILDKYDTLILYGAGKYARELLAELDKCKVWNKDICCGVTSAREPRDMVSGIEVQPIQELLRIKDDALVIVCVGKTTGNYEEMCQNLAQWGVEDFIHSRDLIVDDVWEWQ